MNIAQALDFLRNRRLQIQIPEEKEIQVGDWVILKGEKEKIAAQILTPVRSVPGAKADKGTAFDRKMTDQEAEAFLASQEGETERVTTARKLATEKELKMQFFGSRVGLGGGMTSFFFTSAGPVDFRNLLGDMIKSFSGRIHLERVSERDRTRMIGGVGPCGRAESCCQFTNFCTQKVSLDAVRDQGIVINNNAKIFGVHGKIKSCMLFEVDDYRSMRKYLPHMRQEVKWGDKAGRVIGLDILNLRVKVLFPENDTIEFIPVAELQYPNKKDFDQTHAFDFQSHQLDRESVGI